MAEGNVSTRYSQLADSLATLKQVQETHEKQQAHLQQTVEGLAQQVKVVASNLELLLKHEGKKVDDETNVVLTHSSNPLFEDACGIQTKTICLEFPTFDGVDPHSWLYRANQFFKYHQPHPQQRKPLTWFQELEAAGAFTNWEVFKHALLTRFGPSVYEDAMEALTKLRQTTTVEAYKLREDICYMVRMMRPTSLLTAFDIAKMQEENVAALKRIVRFPMGSPKPQWALPEPPTKMSVLIQRLSPTQMKKRRDKGLCYNCDDKWGLGHRCKSAKLFIMECVDSNEEEVDSCPSNLLEASASSSKLISIELDAKEPEPAISIHALVGSPNPRTMRLIGSIGGVRIVVLIDTRSTHNFVDPSIVTKAQLPLCHTPRLTVKVANSEAVSSEGLTQSEAFQMKGIHFHTEVFVLTSGGCDVVLGFQWLKTLGPILWDFSKLSMAFTYKGSKMALQGLTPSAFSLVEGDDFEKAAKMDKRVSFRHF
ncbi:hypothetical protein I3843_01G173600 [Carya illinoinensis]|nr:hypothetical protein I3843_01G173600 [Carya illinoinensis]